MLLHPRLKRNSEQARQYKRRFEEIWYSYSIFKTMYLSARLSMVSTVIGTSSTVPALISEVLPESLRVTFKSPGIFESTVAMPILCVEGSMNEPSECN
jgi:hypothetical protein